MSPKTFERYAFSVISANFLNFSEVFECNDKRNFLDGVEMDDYTSTDLMDIYISSKSLIFTRRLRFSSIK
ncbi:30S ribosomal protein [Dirofilaria immitis]